VLLKILPQITPTPLQLHREFFCHDAKVMYSIQKTGLAIECKYEEWHTEREAILAPAIK
jgi:hypothetical protein